MIEDINQDEENSPPKKSNTAFVIHPATPDTKTTKDEDLNEAIGLAKAINLDISKSSQVSVKKIRPSTFLGKGHLEFLRDDVKALRPEIIVINTSLSPIQQRNLERALKTKVIDRTGLILEIFGARAQTKEGRLQVELAALEYQKSRLVRSWTHLERQRGATGFIGGPGETQIEIDRRLIGERITKLKKELENVKRTRKLGQKSRQRIPLPNVALVGYTNAGKSTLFNTLTNANIFAEDLLFATLDPTVRRLTLPNKKAVALADTVGFISNLPTHLIAAFRATLEQAISADIIVHVIDVSRKNWEEQRTDVIKILTDLEVEYETDERIFELYNKTDLLDEEKHQDLKRDIQFTDNKIAISAETGEGVKQFLTALEKLTSKDFVDAHYKLKISDGRALSWLYENAEIIKREDSSTTIAVNARIHKGKKNKFEQDFKRKSLSKK